METEGRQRKESYEGMVKGLYSSLGDEAFSEVDDTTSSLLRDLDLVVNRYSEPELIAQGGMKKIYRVTDSMTDRPVAMAVIHGLDSPETVEQFIREARINAQLEHPNVMPVYDMGLDDKGEPFFTMKLITGNNLSTVIKGLRNDDPEYVQAYDLATRLDIFIKVCDAVSYAHSKGVLHLDLKPENVQIGRFGEVLVCDWGLSRYTDPLPAVDRDGGEREDSVLTRMGSICGTPGYLSPEQVTKKRAELDERSDVYGLGALLYTLLSLKVSVAGETAEEMMEATVNGDLKPPSTRCDHAVPAALESVCMHALQTDPDKRYASVDDLKRDVVNYLKGYATAAENAGFLRMLALLVRRHRPVSVTLGIVSLIGLVLVASFTWSLSQKEQFATEKARLAERKTQEALANLDLFLREQRKTETIGREVLPEMEAKILRSLKNMDFAEAWEGVSRAVEVRPKEGVFRKLQACMLIGDHRFAEAYSNLAARPAAELNEYFEFAKGFADDTLKGGPLQRERMTAYVKFLHDESLGAAIIPFLKNADYCFASKKDRVAYVEILLTALNPDAAPVSMRWQPITEMTGRLDLAENPRLTELAPIVLLPAAELNLAGTGVTRAVVAKELPVIRLNLSNSRVVDLHGLGSSSVHYLNLFNTRVTDLAPLEGAPLKELVMTEASVADFTPIKRLPGLRRLEVSDTDVNRQRLRELRLPDRIRVVLR